MNRLGLVLGERDFQDSELYSCHCVVCKNEFIGYKRRVICRVCKESADRARELAEQETQ